jgi:hypothetical protein
MYCFVSVGQNSMAKHLTRSEYEGCSEVLYIQCSGWDDDDDDDTVTLIGKGS